MLLPEDVKAMIASIIPCSYIDAEGDGHHFFVKIVSDAFEGKARLARHRMVKDGLKAKISSNELHALSIVVAATDEEWAKLQA